MAELIKKLHFKQDAIEQTAKAYSTTTEAGTEYIDCYIAVGNTVDSRATKGSIIEAGTTATKAIMSSGKPPYKKIEYRTPGTYTFTVPNNVFTMIIHSAGGGGGGGGAASYRTTTGN